jgi:hypothetical protein
LKDHHCQSRKGVQDGTHSVVEKERVGNAAEVEEKAIYHYGKGTEPMVSSRSSIHNALFDFFEGRSRRELR